MVVVRWGMLLSILSAGCGRDTIALDWTYTFSDPALGDAAEVVVVQIVRGGCRGQSLDYHEEIPGRFGISPEPPEPIVAGRYGFSATAIDARCTRLAEGCYEAMVTEGTGPIRVTLAAAPALQECPVAECDQGHCGLGGGTVPPPRDAGVPVPTDGGLPLSPDAGGIPDAGSGPCMPRNETCNGRDDNCDGLIDEVYDLMSDWRNCGSCGRVCTVPHGSLVCTNGTCGPTIRRCSPEWANRDKNPLNGCETNTD